MFNNIGGKIKTLAKFVAWIGIIGSIIGGIALIATDDAFIATGIIVLLGGSLLSWIGSFFTYGFGELIERTCLIEERSRISSGFTGGSRHRQLDHLLTYGLITEEEYNQKIAELRS